MAVTICATSLSYNGLFAPCTQVAASRNLLRADGAKAFADVLKVNKTLTDIDLSDNEIGAYARDNVGRRPWIPSPEGPAALADGLKDNSSVTKVCVPSSSVQHSSIPSCHALYVYVTHLLLHTFA